MKLFLTTLLLLLCFALHAQEAKLKRAKKAMERGAYQEAIELYLSILNRQDDSEAKKNIAECYRALNNPHEMEYWYGQVVLLPNAEDRAMLYLAQAKLANGKHTEARKWVDMYLKKQPDDIRGQMLRKATEDETIQNLKVSGTLYKVDNAKDLNSPEDDFGPAYLGENKIVISSARDKGIARVTTDARTGSPFTDLFVSKRSDKGELTFSHSKPEKLNKKLNHRYHDGPATFSRDGKEIYFTRNNTEGRSNDGVIRLKIYRADGSDESWANPTSLPFNDSEYSVAHPALSPDGSALYFASNMPGGFGGYDLYVSYRVNDRWEPPINLGPSINTEGNEVFPFIHQDSTLYFASDGLAGLGGLDIYMVEQVYGYWQTPVNLGFPVNSGSDDFGIILNDKKTHGYFVSNRDGGLGGDDIYTFKKLSYSVEVLTYDEITKSVLPGAEVFCSCLPLRNLRTDDEGKVRFDIPMDKSCDFAAEISGYKPNSIRKTVQGMQAGDLIIVQIPLVQEIIYDLSGKISDGYTKEPIEGALVRLIANCDGKPTEDQTLSDREGRYEFKDLIENCDYRIIVSKSGYTEGLVTFQTRMAEGGSPSIEQNFAINCTGANCPDKPACDTCQTNPNRIDPPNPNKPDKFKPDGGPKDFENPKLLDTLRLPNGDLKIINRETGIQKIVKNDQTIIYLNAKGDTLRIISPIGKPELVHIFYDYDDAAIRSDAQPGLDKLVAFMEANPEVKVRLTSHTDARGSAGYNLRLSNRRAESALAYLLRKGISAKRLQAKGMGKRIMINDCYDGVPCSEEQHQENRRTEFIIYDAGGKEYKSLKPATILVNPKPNNTAPTSNSAPSSNSNFEDLEGF